MLTGSKHLIVDIVSPNQGSLVPGQQITDNIIICQGLIYSLRQTKGKKGGMIAKFDLEKTYGMIEWDFIAETLNDVGLPRKLIGVSMDSDCCGMEHRQRLFHLLTA